MSFGASGLVWHHSKASGNDLLVLMAIANYLSDDGAFPKVETIAADARTSVRQVYRSLNVLRDLGEIATEKGAGIGKGLYKTSRYWITLRCPDDCSGDWNHTLRQNVMSRGDKLSPLGVTHTADKPVIEQVNKPNTGDFDKFWEVYPRKTNKGAARKAFDVALRKVSEDVLIDNARRYANDPNRVDHFTKHAATWLNNECWDDADLPERILTPEEKAQRAKVKNDELREQALRQAEIDRLEAERVRSMAAPPPRCVHDNLLISCRICLKGLKSDS